MSDKVYHFAAKVSENGDVSALCFATPKPINLRLASWTIRPNAVTCKRCKRVLDKRAMQTYAEPAPAPPSQAPRPSP